MLRLPALALASWVTLVGCSGGAGGDGAESESAAISSSPDTLNIGFGGAALAPAGDPFQFGAIAHFFTESSVHPGAKICHRYLSWDIGSARRRQRIGERRELPRELRGVAHRRGQSLRGRAHQLQGHRRHRRPRAHRLPRHAELRHLLRHGVQGLPRPVHAHLGRTRRGARVLLHRVERAEQRRRPGKRARFAAERDHRGAVLPDGASPLRDRSVGLQGRRGRHGLEREHDRQLPAELRERRRHHALLAGELARFVQALPPRPRQ